MWNWVKTIPKCRVQFLDVNETVRSLGVTDADKVVGNSRCGWGWLAFRSCRIGKR